MRSNARSSRTRQQLAGYSLIEMVTVIALFGVVMLACGLMMHALLKVDRLSRQEESLSLSLTELTHRFRRDVHRAATSSLSEEPQTLTLELGSGHSIRYQQANHQVQVQQITQGEVTSHEIFRLPGCGLRWEALPNQAGWLMHVRRPALVLTTKVPVEQAGIDFVIEARAQRFGSTVTADTSAGEVR